MDLAFRQGEARSKSFDSDANFKFDGRPEHSAITVHTAKHRCTATLHELCIY